MTLPIEEMGGMTRDGIMRAIESSETNMGQILDTKLEAQSKRLETRLAKQDEIIEAVRTDVISLVGTDKIEGMVPRLEKTLTKFIEKQEQWHEGDLTFRDEVDSRLKSVEKNQKHMKSQLVLMSWMVRVTALAVRAGTFLFEAFHGNETNPNDTGKKKKWRGWLTAIMTFWLVFWQFMHSVLPAIRYSIAHHHISW